MLNSIIRSPALILTVPLFNLIAASYPAHAEIYKWRDNRGVIQYSDRPPVASFTKITRNEMVNALQTKDLCAVGPIKKTVATARNLSAFFGSVTTTNRWNIPVKVAAATTTAAPITTTTAATTTTSSSSTKQAPTSVFNQYSPLSSTSAFNSGNKKVTVFGFPTGQLSNTPKTTTSSTTTTPTVTAPTSPTTTVTAPTTTVAPSTPTTSAPAVTAPAPEPTQVATASPPPSTIPTTSTSANLIQVGLMPAVDISKNMTPAIGYSTLRIEPSNAIYSASHGEFRVSCTVSHMSNDDPIVYPNQQGAAHHHTFFGNTSTNYKSNLATFSATGNSTCHGGIANRSAYWMPSVIDTATNTPVKPDDAIFYYKTTVDGSFVTAPPKGLRMIAGNGKASSEADSSAGYSCLPGSNSTRKDWPWTKTIPKGTACEAGDTLVVAIGFPQCWDGKNLDSPNHQDHMAFPVHKPVAPPNDWLCPASHPIAIPQLSVNAKFNITKQNQTTNWRLASDNYASTTPGGYSLHADWVNGWDETVMSGIVKNCLNAKKDGQAHLLCDGRTLY